MWLPAAIGAGGSLISGIIGAFSQKSANNANVLMQRETNDTMVRMQNNQNYFNKYMWDLNNEYNSPEAQRQRYEDAGINPYLAMGNISSGNSASALQSAPSPNLQAPHVMPLDALAQGAQQATQNLTQLMMAQAQIDKTRAETDVIRQSMPFTLDNLKWTSKSAEYGYKLGKLNYDFENQTLGNRLNLSDLGVTQAQKQVDLLERQITAQDLANKITQIDLNMKDKYAEQTFQAQLSLTLAQALQANESALMSRYQRTQYMPEQLKQGWYNAHSQRIGANASMMNAQTSRFLAPYQATLLTSQGTLNYTQVQKVAADVIKTTEEAAGVKLDNQQKAAVQKFVVGQMEEQYNSLRNSNYYNNDIRNSYENGNFVTKGFWGLYNSGSKFIRDYSPLNFTK